MNFLLMHKQRRFILILAAIGIIAVFLPWVTVGGIFGDSLNANGFNGTGIVVFLSLVAVAVIALMGDQKKAEERNMWMITLMAGFIALLFAIIKYSQISGSAFGIVSAGYGLWIALAASLAVIVFAWLFKNPGDTLQSGFDSLKKNMPHTSHTDQITTTTNTNVNRMEELEKLIELRNQGKITEAEYQEMKSKLM
ncbi:hypothetical protein FAM09_21810 [Niastella caeni]|uniref:SHOCT domain-containing protein n=1 Tax=Niastella caeni TaxID=2569763 RepID=A0A4V4H0C4_9BACT|nr:SHOCT domain-containing protein [Niastella caeni]THU36026.1 hypothetical protein FAM09_21810 [Niastella caeni]